MSLFRQMLLIKYLIIADQLTMYLHQLYIKNVCINIIILTILKIIRELILNTKLYL